jgi:hypothetical protein
MFTSQGDRLEYSLSRESWIFGSERNPNSYQSQSENILLDELSPEGKRNY